MYGVNFEFVFHFLGLDEDCSFSFDFKTMYIGGGTHLQFTFFSIYHTSTQQQHPYTLHSPETNRQWRTQQRCTLVL